MVCFCRSLALCFLLSLFCDTDNMVCDAQGIITRAITSTDDAEIMWYVLTPITLCVCVFCLCAD